VNEKMQTREYQQRFWSKVQIGEEDDCWEWQRATQSHGYGSTTIGKAKTALAHRVAYELDVGEIPERMCVLHRCDNRKCVNPNHLFLGTIQDNNRDKLEKGRQAKGEKNGRTKLSWGQIQAMEALYAAGGCTYRDLATAFNISAGYAGQIIRGKYRDLPLAE
jgi:Autographiviridae endonuclease